jgi:alkylation response protein AidB-like acyl-CoA dehydrogenase
VLAGIGFTTEHEFQRYFRRVRVLDGLFGSSATLTRALGEELIASRQLPPLLAL